MLDMVMVMESTMFTVCYLAFPLFFFSNSWHGVGTQSSQIALYSPAVSRRR